MQDSFLGNATVSIQTAVIKPSPADRSRASLLSDCGAVVGNCVSVGRCVTHCGVAVIELMSLCFTVDCCWTCN